MRFESLRDILLELLDNWSDVKLCLSNDVSLIKKAVNIVHLDSLLFSDRLGQASIIFFASCSVLLPFDFRSQRESSVQGYAC